MSRPKTHRKDGSFRAGNKAHSLPPGERRVVLPAQRVAPATLATLQALAPQHGGIGRAIDALAGTVELRTRERDGARAERNHYMEQLRARGPQNH